MSGKSEDSAYEFNSLPEHLRPREYGHKEIAPLPVRSLIRISQQRGANNPAFENIKNSIDRGDIINPPDVALLKPDSFSQYIDFVNYIWGSDHDITSFTADTDGYYHLVIAGHTRVEAAEQLEDEREKRAVSEGYQIPPDMQPTVWCKIYRDMEPEDILSLQMDENLHEKPSQERTAMAMVETFFYGKITGKWTTKKEYIEANKGKFSLSAFNSALVFCELDEVTRSFVFTKAVAYGPVVELAKTVRSHRDYIAKKYFKVASYQDVTQEEKDEIEDEIKKWNACEIAEIQSKRLNVTACKKRYTSLRDNWDAYDNNNEPETLFLADPSREWRDRRRKTRDTLLHRVGVLAQLPTSEAFHALQLHIEVMGPDTNEGAQLLETLNSGMRTYDKKFQQVVANSGAVSIGSLL